MESSTATSTTTTNTNGSSKSPHAGKLTRSMSFAIPADLVASKRKSKKYSFDSKLGFKNYFPDMDKRNRLFEHFPPLKIKKLKKNPIVINSITGPNDVRHPIEAFTHYACGRTISTYPHIPGKPARDGDPICDSYGIQVLDDNTVIMVVTDGCNWGIRPMEASNRAKNAFIDYLRTHLHEVSEFQDVGHQLLNAICYAHSKIIEGKDDMWDAGTTTLCGGVLLRLEQQRKRTSSFFGRREFTAASTAADSEPLPEWVFACISIGDCKAYWYDHRKKQLTDVSAGNRKNVYDARDCGGRLGPYVGEGLPDLRNTALYYQLCHDSDLIILASDGVHDNLDPQVLGKSPRDIQSADFPTINDWRDIKTEDQVEKLKTWYMCKLMLDSVEGRDEDMKLRMKVLNVSSNEDEDPTSPLRITNRIMKHCLQVTSKGREWMEQNPKDRLPNDYTAYPGKMDHCSAAVVRLAPFDSILMKHIQEKDKDKKK